MAGRAPGGPEVGNKPGGGGGSFPYRRGSEGPSQEEQKEKHYDEAMANAERELAEDAEWKRIQENTFTRWVNEHLRQANTSINDLETDFSNGLKLIALLEVLSGKKMPRHNKKPNFRSQKLENVSIALNFLEAEGVTLVNIDSTDITDCKLKLIMGLIWTLILHYSISMPMYDGPELGGHVEDKSPKQRLLGWMQNKVPGVPINNFTSDWQDGIKVGALVDSVAPGLCPDWDDWDPEENIRNATEAMDLADNWLGVPKLLTPEEIVNPNVDEQSVMTYLSQFPNAKVKENAPLRAKAVASKVKAHGPGLEPTGVVAKAPAKFTVETFGAGDGELNITVKGPGDTDYKVDRSFNNDRKKSWACSYFPDKEGDFVVNITFAGRKIPNSPYNVNVEGFAGDANKVRVAGPGIEPEGVVANKQTNFDIFTEGAGKGKPEVIVLDPHGLKDAIPVRITPQGNDTYTCEYTPAQLGVHSVNVFFAGNPIPESPFGVKVGPASSPGKVWAAGRGLQPHGLRTQETVDFKVFTEGAGEGDASVKIIGPGGVITPTTRRNVDPHTIEFKYTPERDGRYIVMITWGGKEIPKSPFEVKVGPHKTSKIKAYGPGLKGGVVDMPALFTVDTCGETGALGFSIEGPSQAKINCKDNGDGSADVDYTPTSPGQYAVHILCDNDDIPGSPYMADIVPKTDYDPSKVLCFGPGVEGVVLPNVETHFTIDSTKAGKAPLDILFMDDYGEMRPLWKDENGLRDPQNGGIMAVKLIRAKELVKADMVGKSDPYAVIKHGSQKFTTKVIRNTSEPQWDFEAQVTIPDQGDTDITIELFDKDKIGKDKSLGVLTFDASKMVSQKVIEQGWYPLTGVKSGQVLLSADYVADTAPVMARTVAAAQPERKRSHKNLEVNRPLLEKKSEGIFVCTYTPRKTQKQVIWVNYGGVAVPGSPFHVTVDDPTDPSKVKVYGKGVEDGNKAGQLVDFTIDCKDAGPGDLECVILDDKDREVQCKVKDNGDHTFKAEYKPLKNGNHAISVKYDGREIPQSPINVSIKTDIDTRKIKVKGLDDEVLVDCTNEFDVDTSGLPADVTPNIACAIKTPGGSSLPSLKVDKPSKDGNVKVSYTPTQEGKHEISVTADGSPIQGSPFKVTAKKGSDPSKVIAYGPGLEKGIVNEPNQFTIETRNAGTGGLGLAIEGPAEAKMTCKDNRDGSCTVDYVPVVDGIYDISVKYDDKDIPGSPFNVPVEDPVGSSRKSSRSEIGMDGLPDGRLHINLIKARDLIKADMVGKSDPYAVIKYGTQKFKTPVIDNSQEPRWDYEMDFNIPDGNLTEVNFEVFDSDKIGKDKSLGNVNIEISDLLAASSSEGRWYKLSGVKSGEILLSADVLEPARKKSSASLGGSSQPLDGSSDPSKNRKGADGLKDGLSSGGRNNDGAGRLPEGKVKLKVVKAKELVKSDMIGKSDPYAVVKYGKQQDKTKVVKNTQEPKWDHLTEFDVPDGDSRAFNIEVFDSDKIGKDKSLGKVDLDLADILDMDGQEGRWFPLAGVKKGQILLAADFEDKLGRSAADVLDELLSGEPMGEKSGRLSGDPSGSRDGSRKGSYADGRDSADRERDGLIGPNGRRDSTNPDGTPRMGGPMDPFDPRNRRKASTDPDSRHGLLPDGSIPEGTAVITVVKARGLDKADLVGKSDPYTVLTLGRQQKKSPVIKNTLEPQWDFTTQFKVPDGDNDAINLEVFDSDKIGKDKSLGSLKLPLVDVLAMDGQEGRWFPLAGSKKGEVLLMADFVDPYGNDSRGNPSSIAKSLPGVGERRDSSDRLGSRKGSSDEPGFGRKGSADDSDGRRGSSALPGQGGRGGSVDPFDPKNRRKASADPDSLHGLLPDGSIPQGTAVLSVVKARGLAKADFIGKSDPYTVLKYGNQQQKTPVIKNTLEPQWDFTAEFKIPDGKNDEIDLEVFDSDKIGKDKSLGSLKLPLVDVLAMDGQEGRWFPLDGSKKGEILLMADFVDSNGRDSRGHPSALAEGLPGETDPYGSRKGSTDDPRYGRKGSNDEHGGRKGSSATDDARRGSVNPSGSSEFDPDARRGSTNPDGSRRDSDGRGGRGGSRDPLDPSSRRKGSTDPESMHGLLPDGSIPDGTAVISIIKARGLANADILGKSDPYAELVYGRQKKTSPVVKNTLEPQWDFSAELQIPDGRSDAIDLTVYDSDFGKDRSKDKSLGDLSLPLVDVLAMDGQDGRWFPLNGSKNGEVLLMADFVDSNGNDSRGNPSAWAGRLPESDGRKSSTDSMGRKGSNDDGRRSSDALYPGDGRRGSTDPYGSRKDSSDPLGSRKDSYDPNASRKGSMDPHGSRKSSQESEGPGSRGGRGADGLKDKLRSGSGLGGGEADALPSGKAKLHLVKAKDLVKSDLIGKSDPYAVVKFGRQEDKTKTAKNTQEPQWNHEAEFDLPDGDSRSFNIEVFDSDKLGKDKSLGKLNLDITDVLDMDGQDGQWFPLTGVKKGQILLAADFEDDLGRSAGEVLDDLLKNSSGDPAQKKESLGSVGSRRGGANDPYGDEGGSRKGSRGTTDPESERRGSLGADGRRSSTNPDGSSAHDGRRGSTNPDGSRRGSTNPDGSRRDSTQPGQGQRGGSRDPFDPDNRRKASTDPDSLHGLLPDGSVPEGTAVISVVKARGLAKADLIGKSDPYAVLVYGKQQKKTPVVKNTLEPQWDFTAEFDIPDDGDETIFLEVFDSDKIGKDKSLGSLNLPLVNVLAMDGQEGQWFPLADSKKGEILLMADFVDANGNDSRGNPSALANSRPVLGGQRSSDNLLGDRKGSDSKPSYGRKGSSENPELDDEQMGARRGSRNPDGSRKDSQPLRLDPNGRRKASTDPDSLHGLLPDGSIPEGTAVVSLVKARGLAKADLIGKSDPYAVLVYGKQQLKTPVIKNTLEPQWDFTAEFKIPDDGDETIFLEVFDSNKIGRDKSLGSLNLPLVDVLAMDGQEGNWFPLDNSKNGEVLLMTDFVDSNGNDSRGNPSALVNPMSKDRLVDSKPGTGQPWLDNLQDGRARVNLVKAKDLIKTDIVGKSDPYALIRHGSQEYKTPTIKNSQEPQWDAEVEFDIPDGEDSKIHIEIFDEDTVGNDKPMGSIDVDLADLANMNPEEGYWFPLDGVKSGQVLLTGEVMEGLGEMGDVSGDELPSGLRRGSSAQPGQRKSSRDPDGELSEADKAADRANKKKQALGLLGLGAIPEGQVCIDLIKARNLENADRNGKSDPYAVLKFGKQKAKTNTVRNTQNPQWDFSTEFDVPDGEDIDINIEVFDDDKLGRDKSLGTLSLGLDDILKAPEGEGLWYPLDGSKSGELLLASDFLPVGADRSALAGEPGQPIMGGKGSGDADPSKVKAYGPGLEEGRVMPGKPASFTVDSSRTGPAPLEVDLDNGGNGREPVIREIGPGKHEVTYVPPLVGEPYQVGVKYGGEDIPGSPFPMSSNPSLDDVTSGSPNKMQNNQKGLQDRKGSKLSGVGVSVNPDAENLGKVHVGLIAAQDLMKTDLVGKSDPYAILSHGNQKFRTNTVKNTQNPEWNYDADFNVPDGGDDTIRVDIFDSDKLGRDKSLGSIDFPVDDVMNKGIIPPAWYPLNGAKSGQILMTADFEPLSDRRLGSPERGLHGSKTGFGSEAPGIGGRQDSRDHLSTNPDATGASGLGKQLKGRQDSKGQLRSGNDEDRFPDGTLHVDVLGARNLAKSDLIGKSDPYAVVSLGDQEFKTDAVKNTQNPDWNFGADFDINGKTPENLQLGVFDKDKIGKDKPLGSANIPVEDLLIAAATGPNSGTWIPLKGTKSGEVLVSSNFQPDDEEDFDRRMSGHGRGLSRTNTEDAGLRRDSENNGRGGSRKGSNDGTRDGFAPFKTRASSKSLLGDLGQGETPEGNVHVNLKQAKNLMKTDMIGKSDPYAVITCGDDKSKTKTINNTQNPEFNHDAYFPIQEDGAKNIKIDLFDADKLGKDKPLGSINLDIEELVNEGPIEDAWLPLENGKGGQIQLSADFQPTFDGEGGPLSAGHGTGVGGSRDGKGGTGLKDKLAGGRRGSDRGNPLSTDQDELEPGSLHLGLIQAKDLVKNDLIGKSDPYAVISFDDEALKTKTVKNNQNPEWNFDADIPIGIDGPRHVNIDVFDKDKFGKDKCLGSAQLDVADIQDGNVLDKDWIPLSGTKSGKIQVSSAFTPTGEVVIGKGSAMDRVGSTRDEERRGERRDSESILGARKGSRLGSGAQSPDPDEDYDSLGEGRISGPGSRKTSDEVSGGRGLRRGSQGSEEAQRRSGGGAQGLKDRLGGGSKVSLLGSPTSDVGDRDALVPQGNIRLELAEAKNLIKADMIGKADPYAVISYGNDKVKTPAIKNTQNPNWDFDTNIPTDPNGPDTVKIDVFDKDRLGKDKHLGGAAIDIPDLINNGGLRDAWIPLDGVKSGQLRVSADFEPDDGVNAGGYGNNGREGSRHGSIGGNGSRHGSIGGDGSRRGSSMGDGPESRRSSASSSRRGSKLSDSLPGHKTSVPGGHGQLAEEPLGNLHLEILQGKDLVKSDMIGKSDPYAVVTYGDDKIKTNTVKNSQNPEWNFQADIPIDPNGPSNLQIEVFDKDKFGKDKPLGAADIDIPSLMNNSILREAWLPLDGVKSGQVQVSADFTPVEDMEGGWGPGNGSHRQGDSASGAKPNARKPSDNSVAPGNIHLNIVQARDLVKTDLIGKSDPYAVVTYGNDKIMTKTVKNSQNPDWNFEADIPFDPTYSDTLKIEVFDKDKLGKDKLIGTSYLDLPNIADGQPLDEVWIPLKGVKPGKSGEIQLSAEYTPDISSSLYENVQPGGGPRRESGALGAPRSAKSPESDKLGTIKLDLLCAKDLIKTDVVGASDPYAIITHGSQKYKTDILKNTQDPHFNIQCDVDVPDGNDRNISIDLFDADKYGKDTHLGSLNLDIAKVMNLGNMEQGWHPLEGVDQGEVCIGADFVPNYGGSPTRGNSANRGIAREDSSSILINQRFTETRRSMSQFHEVSLNRIPLPATGGVIEASIRTPTGRVDIPEVHDDNSGTVAVKYQPTDEGMHYLDVKYNGDQVQGSPFKFHVAGQNNGKAHAYGPGLTHGVCGELANFTISTKKAGAGGLNLAVEGPSKAEINCLDNKDGTVNVSYLPTAPGEYKITAKFADEHIPGSPFTCKITGEGQKRNQISVGSNSELQLPGNLSESDLRSLKAYIESPSGGVEQCFLKKLPRGNIGISFTPREVGEHLVSVQRKGKHITNSPFKIMVNTQEVGDAARVQVSGEGLIQGATHVNNRFKINTKSAGYGGLSLSIEGPSKAEIDCKDNDDGTLDVDYKPTEPGFYIINIKFADAHVPGSPFQVPISGEGSEKMTENIKRMREAVPVTEVGSQCRLTFKMPGISIQDLHAMVTSPSGRSTIANITELEEGLYAVNFVPQELGIHTVTVRYREMDIPGSPFQFTVGPLQDSGSHRVHAGGPGLERGVEGEAAEFNVWTREAGPGSLAISVEGPAKAQIDFKDRKDGSCYVSYVVEEHGEYSVGIRFNEEHIPGSPYKVCIIPRSESANKVKVSNLDEDQLVLNAPQTFMLNKNGALGSLDCKMVSPSGQVDDCFISTVGPDEYSVRFVPKEEGHHFLHAKLDGVHVPGSPFKVKVGGDGKKDGAVKVFGQGLDRVKTGEKASFVIDTSSVGAGTLSVTVDGPSKVDMDCNEVERGYEVSYTPLVPGDYFVTVKYNGKNVNGSPFKVVVAGGAVGAKQTMQRRQSTTMMMETVEHTMVRQESSVFNQSSINQSSMMSHSRTNSRPIAIQPHFVSDASAVTCSGPGLSRPMIGKQNSFVVDCNGAGNNVLFVGVYGPETPCDEVHVKHQGEGQYGVSYKLTDRGQYILYVKWGDDHIPGSPFHIEV